MITPHCLRAPMRAPLLMFVATLLAMLAGAFTAHAEMSDWASNEGGRMRIVALPPEPDGKVRGVLQIEPKDGWITYWKEPGDSGIPPQLIFSKDQSVRLDSLSFPVPKRIDNGKLHDIGYDAAVSLPFQLTVRDPGKPVALSASAFIGLCRNICIPFQADFSLKLAPVNGTPVEEAMIVGAAASHLPSPPSDDFRVSRYVMADGGKTLRLTLQLPADATARPEVIVTGPEGHVLVDETKARHETDGYVIDMPIGKLPKGYEMKGQRWGILVIAGAHAIETSLAFD